MAVYGSIQSICKDIVGIYLSKVSSGNTATIFEICSKVTIKTPEWQYWHRSSEIIIDFNEILDIVLVFPPLTLNRYAIKGLILDRWNLIFLSILVTSCTFHRITKRTGRTTLCFARYHYKLSKKLNINLAMMKMNCFCGTVYRWKAF